MSTISSLSSSMSSAMNSTSSTGQMRGHHHRKPDTTQMASDLFSALDTKNQGYIEKSDLQSAFSQISSSTDSSSTSSSTSSSSSVDELFSQLDADSDGKITEDEMASGLKKLADELESQFNSMRQNGYGSESMSGMGGMSGMQPPPPPPENDTGFTKDELTQQLSEIGSSDSQRSALLNNIINNFDSADSDSDGKVSFQEAMSFDQQSKSATNSTSTTSSSSTNSTSSTQNDDAKLMLQIMQLLHAYGSGQNTLQNSLLSASA